MSNADVAEVLRAIAELLELQGGDLFKVRAYRRAADTAARWPEPLTEVWRRGELTRLPGIGQALAAKVAELLETGRIRYLEELRAGIPPGLQELVRIPGLGPRTAWALHQHLGITGLADLAQACREGRVRGVPGFGPRRESALIAAVEAARRRRQIHPAYALWPLATQVLAWMQADPGCRQTAVAGALRRMAATADAVVLVAAGEPEALARRLAACPYLSEVEQTEPAGLQPPSWDLNGDIHRIQGLARTATGAEVPVTVWAAPPSRFAAALLSATGSPAHLEALAPLGAIPPDAGSEAEIYAALGLAFIPPELREGAGEVAAAAQHQRFDLIRLEQVRGDLHCHTHWSDGQASVAEMAAAAQRLGREYVALTDHSRSLRVAGGLSAEQFRHQAQEIATWNAAGNGPHLLRGVEVEIHKDGSLDFPDSVLAQFDLVVAAVHSHFGLDQAAMTARLERAIRNPHVDILAHPTGRRLGDREPYGVDLERLFAAARSTGTALEINGSPARLDLDGDWVRAFRGDGLLLAVNTDAHSPAELEGMVWGVGQARRGGLTAAEVINTWPLDQLLSWLRQPRG